MADPQDNGANPKVAACRVAIADAEKALAWIQNPQAEPVFTRYREILADYERILHDVNVDPEIRDRAAFIVDVTTKLINIGPFFEQKKKAALQELEHELEPASATTPIERVMTFMR